MKSIMLELTKQDILNLTNESKRKAVLADWKNWGIWHQAPEIGLSVYRLDLPDGSFFTASWYEGVKPDPVNRPAHYTSGGIECIDAMQAAFGYEAVKDFCLCNAFKYLWRHRNKNGVEDLKKACWYLNRLIREMEVTGDE